MKNFMFLGKDLVNGTTFVPSVLNINRKSSYYKAVFEQMKASHKIKFFGFIG